MSKLDRHLDDIKGVKRVEIVWPMTEELYLQQLRTTLKREIDRHLDRVPLDLRKVTGAPDALIDLLLEMRECAESRGKQLVVTHAQLEMRESLTPRRHRVFRKSENPKSDADVSALAAKALETQPSPIRQFRFDESESAEAERRLEAVRKPKLSLAPQAKRFLTLGVTILFGTSILVGGYWLYVFKLNPDEQSPPAHGTSFEGQSQ